MPFPLPHAAQPHAGRCLGWACAGTFVAFLLLAIAVATSWSSMEMHRSVVIVRPATPVDRQAWEFIAADASGWILSDTFLRAALVDIGPDDLVPTRNVLRSMRDGIKIQCSAPPQGPCRIKLLYEGHSHLGPPLIVRLAVRYAKIGPSELARQFAEHHDRLQRELAATRIQQAALIDKADKLGRQAQQTHETVQETRMARTKLANSSHVAPTAALVELQHQRRWSGRQLVNVLNDRSQVLSEMCRLGDTIQDLDDRRASASRAYQKLAATRLVTETEGQSVNLAVAATAAPGMILLCLSVVSLINSRRRSDDAIAVGSATDAAAALRAPVLVFDSATAGSSV